MTTPTSTRVDEAQPAELSSAERRARRIQRDAVDRACSRLAASGELTEERRRVVATLAARLRRRLVDGSLGVATGQSTRPTEEELDPAVVAALFSE